MLCTPSDREEINGGEKGGVKVNNLLPIDDGNREKVVGWWLVCLW